MNMNKFTFGMSVVILLVLLGLTIKFIFDGIFAPAIILGVMALGYGAFVRHDFRRLND